MTEKQEERLIEALELIAIALVNLSRDPNGECGTASFIEKHVDAMVNKIAKKPAAAPAELQRGNLASKIGGAA